MDTSNTTIGTVCYLLRKTGDVEEICLAWKEPTPKAIKRGLANKWNSYGGGAEPEDTSIEATAVRELFEESGVVAETKDIEKVADILFVNPWGNYHCHFFLVRKWSGEPRATREMSKPTWFPFNANTLPFEKMMDSDRYVLPPIIEGQKPKGNIYHDEKMKVTRADIDYVDSF